MKHVNIAAMFIALGALSACATIEIQFDPSLDHSAQQTRLAQCADSPCTPRESLAVLQQAFDYCQTLQTDYQGDGLFNSRFRVFIASFGALAGSVFAPIASGAARTAWSGLSGATNGIQSAFDQSFSALQMAKRRAVIAKIIDDFARSHDSKSIDSSLTSFTPTDAALLMAQCSVAAALADQDTLAAMATSAKTTPPDYTCRTSKPDATGVSSLTCSNQTSFTCTSKPDATGASPMTCSSKNNADKPQGAGAEESPRAAANNGK